MISFCYPVIFSHASEALPRAHGVLMKFSDNKSNKDKRKHNKINSWNQPSEDFTDI